MTELCTLTPRLAAIADLAAPCRVLADIGTDHAHLPVYMLLNGSCRRAFACDVNEGPLCRARGTVEKYGLSQAISLIRSDGLHQVPEEYDTLVIAGMGGDLIARILFEHPPVCAEKILLQPMTKPEVLRRFLFRHGYSVLRERAVTEGERHYIILQVTRGTVPDWDDILCHLPRNPEPSSDMLDYLEKLLNSHQRRLLGLRRAEVADPEAIRFEETLSLRLRELWQTISRRLYDEAR